MGNLATNKVYAWTPDDYKVSETMQEYFANFVKTGDPNGTGPAEVAGDNGGWNRSGPAHRCPVEAQPETHRDRYLLMDSLPQPRM